jgi:hypothetical protein
MRKYVRMFNMGIPAPAVKIKMQSEGYDPSLLDVRILFYKIVFFKKKKIIYDSPLWLRKNRGSYPLQEK